MRKKNFLFDFDGTVADSVPWIVKTLNYLAPDFGFQPISDKEYEECRSYTIHGLIKKFNVPLYKLPFYIVRTRKELTDVIPKMGLCIGIRSVLYKLKKDGMRLAIVSSSPKAHIEAFLENHKLDVFEFVHSELNIFGKAAALNQVIQKYRMKREETVYAGDEIRDIMACKRAGLDMIAVSWGFNNEKILRKKGAIQIAHKPLDFLEILQKNYS
ncbi:MAG: HAD hydrolase-like protein [Patescibacteria group bacterium]